MRVAIYHNLPDGGAIRALYELVKTTAGEVEYDLYQLGSVNKNSRYNFVPFVNRVYSHNYDYNPSGIDLIAEILTNFSQLKGAQRAIASDIDARGYDLVFVHHCGITQTPLILNYLKTPSLYYIQEPRRLSFEKSFYKESLRMIHPLLRPIWRYRQRQIKSLDSRSAKKANASLCNSKFSQKQILATYGLSSTVCYLGIDAKLFSYKKSKKKNQAILVGTIHPAKGQLRAVKAIADTSRKGTDLSLLLVYENADQRFLKQVRTAAKKLRVELSLRQGLSDAGLAEAYRASKMTLCLADREPFGFTPLESSACGTPVVAINEGGYAETIQSGRNGVLVEKSTPAIVEGIEGVLEKKWDSRRMSDEVKEKWGWRSSADVYLKEARKVIHG